MLPAHRLRRFSVWAAALGFAASCGAAQELVIGQCAPLTGSYASTGKDLALGVKLAVEEANAAGGINGQRVKHVVRDDGYDVARTVECTRELIRQHAPVGLVGYAGTGNISEVLKQNLLADGPYPLIAPFTGGAALREPYNPYIFHIRASYDDEIRAIVNQIAVSSTVKRVAVFYQDDVFGQSGLASAQKALKERGMEPVAVGAYAKNTEDVDKAVAAIAQAAPQAVIAVAITRPLAVFLKKLKEKAPGAQVYGLALTDTEEVAKIAGDAATRGLGVSRVVPRPFTAGSPHRIVQDYQAALVKFAPNEHRSYASLEEYIGTRVLLDAIRRAPQPVNAAGVTRALEQTRLDLNGFRVAFEPGSRIGSRFVEITLTGTGGKVTR